jgi:hypothetical protein
VYAETKMRTRLTIAAFVVLGLTLGYGIGFATSVVGTVSDIPMMANPYASRDSFTSVFKAIGRLGAAEDVAGFCGSPKKDPLASEDFAIRAIEDRAGAASLNPPLDVARARLAVRRAIRAESDNDLQLKTRYEETANELLKKSGWKDPSASHLRQIVTRLDAEGNTCSPSQAKGGQQK